MPSEGSTKLNMGARTPSIAVELSLAILSWPHCRHTLVISHRNQMERELAQLERTPKKVDHPIRGS